MKVIFSNRAFSAVLAETTEMITTETGGLFLGAVKDDVWYVIEAIDPGPKAIFDVDYFEYDQKYTQHLINKIANLYNKKLDVIGLWHRHPGSFDYFSPTDDETNTKYASMREEGAVSGLVNIDPKFRFTMYHVAYPCRYTKITYEVDDNLIPSELLEYKTNDSFYDLMEKRSKILLKKDTDSICKSDTSLESFMSFVKPYILKQECNFDKNISTVSEMIPEKIVDALIDDLMLMSDGLGIKMTLTMQEKHLVISQKSIGKITQLYFMISDIEKNIIFIYDDKAYIYYSGMFSEAVKKAESKQCKQIKGLNVKTKIGQGHSGCILDSVFKIIKHNNSREDTNDGN